jgi:hypothetical protein
MNYMMVFKFDEKGNFYSTKSTRQEQGYDIYFVPEGKMEMIYISTVNDSSLAHTHCLLYKETHNRFIAERKILGEIAEDVHRQELTDKAFIDAIRARLEKKRSRIEEILGRPMTEKDLDDYIVDIIEWYA